ncbi:MAG: hypothetical protein KBD78_05380 [Oligoflexales bacterium]|nr:hypothetical protein [Oligoflexales bacterium]
MLKNPPNIIQHIEMIGTSKELQKAWEQVCRSLVRSKSRKKKIGADATKEPLKPKVLSLETIARSKRTELEEMWTIYTQQRGSLGFKMLNRHEQVLTYLLGFHLANTARMQSLVDRLQQRIDLKKLLSSAKKIELFDIGCGTGATHQPLLPLISSKGPALQMHLIDQNRLLVDAAKSFAEKLLPSASIQNHRFLLQNLLVDDSSIFLRNKEDDTLKITVLGYVWNELIKTPQARHKMLGLFKAINQKQLKHILFVLEPAEEYKSRKALELREELINAGYKALYPCSQTSHSCPMLASNRDWCFSEAWWQKPKTQQAIDFMLGLKRERLAYTGMVFASAALNVTSFMKGLENKESVKKVVVGQPTQQTNPRTKTSEQIPVETFNYLLCDGEKLSKSEQSFTANKNQLSRGEIWPL